MTARDEMNEAIRKIMVDLKRTKAKETKPRPKHD